MKNKINVKLKESAKAILSTLLSVCIVSLLFAVVVKATVTYSVPAQLPASGYNPIPFGGGGLLKSISVINTNTAANLSVTFYDAPYTNTTYTNQAYTNYTYTIGTATNIFTNVLGKLATNTYPVIITTTNNNPLATVNWPVIATIVVPTNSTVTIPFSSTRVANGLLSTNPVTGHGGITYQIDGFNN